MPDRGQLRSTLLSMWRIRAFEEEVLDLWRRKEIVGSVHLCNGQEAVAVGACGALRPDDPVFATYRGHGWALSRGVPARALFAELLGRESGTNGGRGGSAYLSAPDQAFYGENSIVGAGAPLAVGAALACDLDGSGRVAVAVFGDGAMNQGSVHEALNFAAARHLPVVFLCENNGYSELTPIADMVGNPRLADRSAGYGMPGYRIDGNDVPAVRGAMGQALELARSGGGPTLLEAVTQRLVGHYIGDAEAYRPPGELDAQRITEPIARLGRDLLALGVSARDLALLEQAARRETRHAADAALLEPRADPSRAREHMYA
jgi:TPP-dependent pyruvate/acetoin dehydrogenase alpha subunit